MLILLVVGALSVVVAVRSSASTVTRTYTQLTQPVPNPERGWYDRIDTILTVRDFSESTRDGVTLLHSYVQLDAYRDSDIPESLLARLDEGLAAVRRSGLKIIVRFAYNQGPYPASEPDASKDRILAHIAQVGPVLQHNKDVVAAVEAGFVGAWGEWHTSTNGLDTDTAAKREILTAERDAFPGQLLLRYPSDLRALRASTSGRTVGGDTVATSTGVHQDCFLSSSPDDSGTWGRDGSSVAADKALVAAAGRYAVVGGETCNSTPPARTNCTTAVGEMAQMHFTYLNRDYEPNSLAQLAACRQSIEDRLGYRLRLLKAAVPKTVDPGTSSAGTELTIRNVGFASPYAKRPAYVVTKCGTRITTAPLGSDIRTWDPGQDIGIEAKARFVVPKGVTSCRLGLWLPDAATGLRASPAYAIRLATATTWSGGVNYFGVVPVDH